MALIVIDMHSVCITVHTPCTLQAQGRLKGENARGAPFVGSLNKPPAAQACALHSIDPHAQIPNASMLTDASGAMPSDTDLQHAKPEKANHPPPPSKLHAV